MTTLDARTGLDRAALEELYADYGDLLDEERLDERLDLFVPDASHRAVARDNWARGLPLSTMACESHAMLSDRDGRLLFAEKVAVYDSDVIPTSLVYPL